jgi:hypothetical protein
MRPQPDGAAPSAQVVIPGPRAIIVRAWPNLVEGKLVPLALFVGFLELAGVPGAVLAALTFSLACIGYRLGTRRRVPGLVILSAVGLAAKTILAVATGSLVVYFLQPTITTALVGAAFLVSVPLGRPLAEKLTTDFCPFDPETASNPELRRFFLRLSLLWAGTSLANASVTLWLLVTQSVTTFVVVKSFLGSASTALTLVVGIVWFRHRMHRAGVRVVFARATPTHPVRRGVTNAS